MKPKRVNCLDCANFIRPVFDENWDNLFISKIIERAKCKLGKRVMFRTNGLTDTCNYEVGYFRYCDEFKQIEYAQLPELF